MPNKRTEKVEVTAFAGSPRFEGKQITVKVFPADLQDEERLKFVVQSAFANHIRQFVVVNQIIVPGLESEPENDPKTDDNGEF